MAMPMRVLLMNKVKAIKSTTVEMMINTCAMVMLKPMISMLLPSKMVGNCLVSLPISRKNVFCSTMDVPMVQISIANFGCFRSRSGRRVSHS